MKIWQQYPNCYSDDDIHYEYFDDDGKLIVLDAGQNGVTKEHIIELKSFHRGEIQNEEQSRQKRWSGGSTKCKVVSYDALRRAALEGTDILLDPSADPEQILELAEEAERMESFLRHIPPKQRELILSYFYDGVKETEMAERFGLSQQAIQRRVDRARKKFCKQYVKYRCNFAPKSLKGRRG